MDRSEQLSLLNLNTAEMPGTTKAVINVNVTEDESIIFTFKSGETLTVPRSMINYISSKIESLDYINKVAVFTINDGRTYTIRYSIPVPINEVLLPAIKTVGGFKSLLLQGNLSLENGMVRISRGYISPSESPSIESTGGSNVGNRAGGSWDLPFSVTLAQQSIPESIEVGTDKVIVLKPGRYIASGNFFGIVNGAPNGSYAVFRMIDEDTGRVLLMSNVQKIYSSNASDSGGMVRLEGSFNINNLSRIRLESYLSNTANTRFTYENIGWFRFGFIMFYRH